MKKSEKIVEKLETKITINPLDPFSNIPGLAMNTAIKERERRSRELQMDISRWKNIEFDF